jgi:N-acetylneuraminic acid mutarotase
LTDPFTIANKFNEYFVNVGPRNSQQNTKRTINEYLSHNYKDSFFLEPITKYEIETEIKTLNSKKKIANEISEPLAHIFNLAVLSGIIPHNLKIARVFSNQMKLTNSKIIDPYLFCLASQKY